MIGIIFPSGKQMSYASALFYVNLIGAFSPLSNIVTLAAKLVGPEWRQVQDAGFQVKRPFRVQLIDNQYTRLFTASR